MLSFFFSFFSLFLLCNVLKFGWLRIYIYLGIFSLIFLIYIYNPILSFSYVDSVLILDSISSCLILLSIWISCLIYISRQFVYLTNNNYKFFLFFVLALCFVLLVSFSVNNILFFYFMFEVSLVPTLILVIGWGYQPERLQAGIYLIIYTITASLPLLVSLIYIYNFSGSLYMYFNLASVLHISGIRGLWWFITIMAFIVKIPIYLTHLWLPKAHVEAPVAGSIILAAVLLKLGSYGLLRIRSLVLWSNSFVISMFVSISMWGACITRFICMRQNDIKSLIAYSSVGHIGLLIRGIMSSQVWGWYGSIIIMIAHGLVSSGLFSIGNITYENTSTRRLYLTKGLLSIMPVMSIFWFVFSAINIACPPSINLLGEIMLLSSILSVSFSIRVLIAISRFIAACYSLYLYTCIHHGQHGISINTVLSLNIRNISIIVLHGIPVFFLILSSQFVSCWI